MKDKIADLRKAASSPTPDNVPAALAWLWRMYALLTSLFTKDLPELEEAGINAPAPDAPPVFTVIAWSSTHREAEIHLARPDLDEESRAFYEAVTDEPSQIVILAKSESTDPADVDFLIADLGSKFGGGRAALTLVGPGIALRLNRKARRAATARVRRAFRREERADLRGMGKRHRNRWSAA